VRQSSEAFNRPVKVPITELEGVALEQLIDHLFLLALKIRHVA
jgi:hypothetical protein